MNDYLYDGATFLDGKGNFVKIGHDPDCESPREYDNLGTFVTWMRSYSSPDGDMTPEDIICDLGLWDEFEDSHMPYDKYGDPGDEDVQLNWLLEKAGKGEVLLLPVSGYEHSGLTLRVGWPTQFVDWQWDAGFAGVIYTTKERAEKFMGREATREDVLDALKQEVDYYDTWGNGNCWGFVTYDKLGNEVDSCWGFIGETTECMEHEFEGGLHDCEFKTLYEYVESHKDDPDVLVARYNEAKDERDELTKTLGKMLGNIVNTMKLDVRFVNDRLVLEA